MPRTKAGTPPKYQEHKPSGRAKVRIAGRDYWLGKYGSTESWDRYHAIIDDWRRAQIEPDKGGCPMPKNPKLEEVMAAYLLRAESYYRDPEGRPTSEVSAIAAALRYVAPFAEMRARDFSPKHLRQVRDGMARAGMVLNGINRQVVRVRSMFKWAADQELVPASTWHALCCVRGLMPGRPTDGGVQVEDSEDVTPVDDAIVEKTLERLPPTIQDMVRLQRLTGMRPGEVCRMTPGEINVSGKIWVYRPKWHKCAWRKIDRVIDLGPRAQAILGPRLQACGSTTEAIFSPSVAFAERRAAGAKCRRRAGQDETPRRSARRMGDRWTTETYRRAIQRACVQAGVEVWSPNQIRHTAATAIREEFGAEAAQVMLGHTNLRTTEIYAERSRKRAAELAAKVG